MKWKSVVPGNVVQLLFIFLLIMNVKTGYSQDFKSQQKKYARVRQAYTDKGSVINKLLKDKGIDEEYEIFIRAFKQEEELEVWVKGKSEEKFILLKTFDFCALSGSLGPKRQQGDGQVPEGFYYIDRFNPVSSFHLSLGINYPNSSDRTLCKSGNPGGDIFIHGDCVTIGCIPITDDKIKELYILAVEAKNSGQKNIPVHIFPAKLSQSKLVELKKEYKDPNLFEFWQNLAEGYSYFEENKTLPSFWINKEGSYIFK